MNNRKRSRNLNHGNLNHGSNANDHRSGNGRRRPLHRYALAAIAGLALCAIALVGMPSGVGTAQAQSGVIMQYNWPETAPAAPTNLRGYYSDTDRTGWRHANYSTYLDWDDGTSGRTFCITLLSGMRCVFRADAGQATYYVLERQQPAQRQDNGYPIIGQHDWTRIADPTGLQHNDTPFFSPPRNMEYRVKACNTHGCSGWSNTITVRVQAN